MSKGSGDQTAGMNPRIMGVTEVPCFGALGAAVDAAREGLHGIAKGCSLETKRILSPALDPVKEFARRRRVVLNRTQRISRQVAPGERREQFLDAVDGHRLASDFLVA